MVRVSVAFALALFVMLPACSDEDIKPYVQESEAVLGTSPLANLAVAAGISTQVGTDQDTFFSRIVDFAPLQADRVALQRKQWAEIKPPKSQKGYHRRTLEFFDETVAHIGALAEAARARDSKTFFAGLPALGDLITEQNELHQERIRLYAKAKVDSTLLEANVRVDTPEVIDRRNYWLAVLPVIATINWPTAAAIDQGASGRASLQAKAGFNIQALVEAKARLATITVPAAATAYHQPILSLNDSLLSMYRGLAAAAVSGKLLPIAEAVVTLPQLAAVAVKVDCEWRRLAESTGIFRPGPAQDACPELSAAALEDIDYAVRALLVVTGAADAVGEINPVLVAASGQPSSQSFPGLRVTAAALKTRTTGALAEARSLAPPASRAAVNASFIQYLTEIDGLATELQNALATTEVARYNELLPRIRDLFGPRLVAFSAQGTSLVNEALARR